MSSSWTRYARVIWYQVGAELKTERSKTYIGVLWWILDPVIYMAVFYVVFSTFRGRDGADFVQFLLVGLVFLRWFSNAVASSPNSIISSKGLIQQVYLPKIVFPMVSFLQDTFKFSITLAFLLLFLWISGFPPSAAYFALPGLMLIQLIFNLGMVLFTAAIVPFVPDLRFLVSHFLMVMLFTSGIFYTGDSLPQEMQKYFYMNPLACLFESYRDVLLYNRPVDWQRLMPGTAGAMTLLLVAIWLLRRFDRIYPRIIKVR